MDQKGKVKAKDLADRFEVSLRTIYRDVDAICLAGIPLVTFPGGDGGIKIADGLSMLPKIQAASRFAASKEGRTALITLLEKARDCINGKTGTKIHH